MFVSHQLYSFFSLKNAKKEILESVQTYLVSGKALTFNDCISWARHKFENYFNANIQQLLYNFPKDAVTNSGSLFWSSPKRAPEPISFDHSKVRT